MKKVDVGHSASFKIVDFTVSELMRTVDYARQAGIPLDAKVEVYHLSEHNYDSQEADITFKWKTEREY